MFKTLSQNGLMLAGFAIVTTALISLTFSGTKDTIEEQQQQRLLRVLSDVVPSDFYDTPLYQHCTVATDSLLGNQQPHTVYQARKDNTTEALVIEATAPDGYSGNIELVIGVSSSMEVLGVRVIDHKETPGLGDKIELSVSDWIRSFTGKQFNETELSRWQVKKDGGEFDQFTGATITPRAVVSAVKNALLFAQQHFQELANAPNQCLSSEEQLNE